MNDDEIFEILREQSADENIFKFIQELFFLEIDGTTNWKKTYDVIIDEYIKKM